LRLNFIDNDQGQASGSKSAVIWSVVITKLDMSCWETLNINGKLDNTIRWVSENIMTQSKYSTDQVQFREFCNDLKK